MESGDFSKGSTGPITMRMYGNDCFHERASWNARRRPSQRSPVNIGSLCGDRAGTGDPCEGLRDEPVCVSFATGFPSLQSALPEDPHAVERELRYKAVGAERGAESRCHRRPLAVSPLVESEFNAVRSLATESERLARLDENCFAPATAGQADLTNHRATPLRQPHLVPGPGPPDDPMQRLTRVGLGSRPGSPVAGAKTPRISTTLRSNASYRP